MSHNEQENAHSLFWARLRENARSIVEREKADLQKKTVDPDYCLLPSDKDIMAGQQYMIGQMVRDIERLRTDGCRSRALALFTVLTSQPSLLFK